MVARKMADAEKEMPDQIEKYDKGDSYCKICDKEQHTHNRLVKHYQKYHENKALFQCHECCKLFITSEGHQRHVLCHNEDKRIKCTDTACTKTFMTKLGLKAHLKLKHSGPKDRIPCKFVDKGCTKNFSVKGNMVEHTVKCKFNPDGIKEMKCEICHKGGFYQVKRILAHKRDIHGWD